MYGLTKAGFIEIATLKEDKVIDISISASASTLVLCIAGWSCATQKLADFKGQIAPNIELYGARGDKSLIRNFINNVLCNIIQCYILFCAINKLISFCLTKICQRVHCTEY